MVSSLQWVVAYSDDVGGDDWPTACYGPFESEAAALAWRDQPTTIAAFGNLTAVLLLQPPASIGSQNVPTL